MIAYTGISVAASSTAGEEEEAALLGLTLAYPIERSRLLLSKAAAVAVSVALVAVGTFVGSSIGSVGRGGVGFAHIAALSAHLAFFGWAVDASRSRLARRPDAGRSPPEQPQPSAVLRFLVDDLRRSSMRSTWLEVRLASSYYYEGHDPIGSGTDTSDLAVLAAVALALTMLALVGLRQRDPRK